MRADGIEPPVVAPAADRGREMADAQRLLWEKKTALDAAEQAVKEAEKALQANPDDAAAKADLDAAVSRKQQAEDEVRDMQERVHRLMGEAAGGR